MARTAVVSFPQCASGCEQDRRSECPVPPGDLGPAPRAAIHVEKASGGEGPSGKR